jgi:FkbM family methyltransferase
MDKLDSFKSRNQFVVFGAGEASAPVVDYLYRNSQTVISYSDNNSLLHGCCINGIKVIPPSEIRGLIDESTGVIIASSAQSEIYSQLVDCLGISHLAVYPYMTVMFAPQYGEQAYNSNQPYIPELLSSLADEESKCYVKSLIEYRRTMNPLYLKENPKATGFYEYHGKKPFVRDNDTIVDCGAYIGDTAQNFIERATVRKVYAFEGLSFNFARLTDWINENNIKNIIPVKAFLGSDTGTLYLNSTTAESADPRANLEFQDKSLEVVQVVRLDDVLSGNERIDLIKIDVEGADLDVLKGGSNLIADYQPRIMVAAYHKSEHLWQIPRLLRSYYPNCLLYAGHHPKCVHEIEFYLEIDN